MIRCGVLIHVEPSRFGVRISAALLRTVADINSVSSFCRPAVEQLLAAGFGIEASTVANTPSARQARIGRGVVRMSDPGFLASLCRCLPHGAWAMKYRYALGSFPALALEDPARLSAAGGVAGARTAEPNSRADTGGTLHDAGPGSRCWSRNLTRHRFNTPSCIAASTSGRARAHPLIQRGHNARARCKPVPRRHLRAGDEWRAVVETGGRSRAAGALRDVLIDLAVLVRARTKP